jgi:hypothetical protein
MICDVGVTSEFEMQLVNWRGNGTSDQNQYVPKIFTLGVGTHELSIQRGAKPIHSLIALVGVIDPSLIHLKHIFYIRVLFTDV